MDMKLKEPFPRRLVVSSLKMGKAFRGHTPFNSRIQSFLALQHFHKALLNIKVCKKRFRPCENFSEESSSNCFGDVLVSLI